MISCCSMSSMRTARGCRTARCRATRSAAWMAIPRPRTYSKPRMRRSPHYRDARAARSSRSPARPADDSTSNKFKRRSTDRHLTPPLFVLWGTFVRGGACLRLSLALSRPFLLQLQLFFLLGALGAVTLGALLVVVRLEGHQSSS